MTDKHAETARMIADRYCSTQSEALRAAATIAEALAAAEREGYRAGQRSTGGVQWRHKKRGTTYTEVGRGKMQTEHWEERLAAGGGVRETVDMQEVVIYCSDDDGSLWVRPVEEFEDGRFERVGVAPGPSEAHEGGSPGPSPLAVTEPTSDPVSGRGQSSPEIPEPVAYRWRTEREDWTYEDGDSEWLAESGVEYELLYLAPPAPDQEAVARIIDPQALEAAILALFGRAK